LPGDVKAVERALDTLVREKEKLCGPGLDAISDALEGRDGCGTLG
jgi:hypothetical protein